MTPETPHAARPLAPPPPPVDPSTYALASDALKWRCDLACLGFESVAEFPLSAGIIGQNRAIAALQLAFRIRSKGHNVFVCGPAGFGRTTTVRHVLDTLDTGRGAPPDIVYVHNFRDPDRPVTFGLPAGRGRVLRLEMEGFIETARREIARLLDSEELDSRRRAVAAAAETEDGGAWRGVQEQAAAAKLALVEVEAGGFSHPEFLPLIHGAPVAWTDAPQQVAAGKISAKELLRLQSAAVELQPTLRAAAKQARDVRRRFRDSMAALEVELARPIVEEALEDVRERFPEKEVALYLAEVRQEVLRDLRRFIDEETPEGPRPKPRTLEEDGRYRSFLVNVVVDNTGVERPPVVIETWPSHRNLFGAIERIVSHEGPMRADFLNIKAGSLLRANGGFLVLDLSDVNSDPSVWTALKRALRNQQVDIGAAEPASPFSTSVLEPQPVAIDVRVVVLGDSFTYQLLYGLDPDFRKIFKVKAEFDSVMPRDETGIRRYAGFLRGLVETEKLLWPDPGAVAEIVEFGARLAGQRRKLSTRFSDLADLLREASYWAERMELPRITREAVQRAIEEHRRRLRLPEEKLQEAMIEGTLRVETTGSVVGQVNGLSVYDLGDYSFGKPTRITAQGALGQGGLVSIEREAALSGRSFNKATMILEGFFRSRFGQEFPLSMTASIAFEQSYGEVDGDSASVAELVAVVSTLAELPVRQDLAITGSVDQIGRVQPIGGADEKIEGFFELCEARGLTGAQGVIIPRDNVEDLMLRDEVVAAVAEGRFHVYGVDRVEQALELLLGVGVGALGPDGLFQESSIFGRVQDKLHYYADRMKEFGKSDGGPGEPGPDGAQAGPGPTPPPAPPPSEPTPPGPPPSGPPPDTPTPDPPTADTPTPDAGESGTGGASKRR